MTDPSKAYRQSKQPSPKNLDDQILAAAKDQAELNSASRNFTGGYWIQTAAFASVCLVGLSFVFDSQFTNISDPYAEYAEVQSLSEIQLDPSQTYLTESGVAPEPTADGTPVRTAIDLRQRVAQIPNSVGIDLDGDLVGANLEVDNLQQNPIEPSAVELEFGALNDFAGADGPTAAGAEGLASESASTASLLELVRSAEITQSNSIISREQQYYDALTSLEAARQEVLAEAIPERMSEPTAGLPYQTQETDELNEIVVAARGVEESVNDVPSLAGGAQAVLNSEADKAVQSQDSAIQDEAVIEPRYSASAAFANFADSAEMANQNPNPNPNLVNLIDYIPNFAYDLRYFGENNFVGRPIDGYLDEVVLLSAEAAEALARVQIAANRQGLGVKVFDAYRPQRAVDHFVRWAQDLNDQSTKQNYYPYVNKAELFEQGYIAEQSGHSRGSTLDLTLIDLATGIELDMGTPFDFFDPLSWPLSEEVSQPVQQNRLLLRSLMLEQGFIPYEAEWWHFTLANEPYSDQYFDLPVE